MDFPRITVAMLMVFCIPNETNGCPNIGDEPIPVYVLSGKLFVFAGTIGQNQFANRGLSGCANLGFSLLEAPNVKKANYRSGYFQLRDDVRIVVGNLVYSVDVLVLEKSISEWGDESWHLDQDSSRNLKDSKGMPLDSSDVATFFYLPGRLPIPKHERRPSKIDIFVDGNKVFEGEVDKVADNSEQWISDILRAKLSPLRSVASDIRTIELSGRIDILSAAIICRVDRLTIEASENETKTLEFRINNKCALEIAQNSTTYLTASCKEFYFQGVALPRDLSLYTIGRNNKSLLKGD